MYVLSLSCYRSSFYNLWLKGNTCIGSNFTVKTNFNNIDCVFDGGVADTPEYFIESKYSNITGYRFGCRLNVIGFSILHGYAGVIENCDIDFGGKGKVSMMEQTCPVVNNNRSRNLSSPSGCVQGSIYGYSIINSNYLSSLSKTVTVSLYGEGNIVNNNIIESPQTRWYSAGIDLNTNDLNNNHVWNLDESDALYAGMPSSKVTTSNLKTIPATNTIKPGNSIDLVELHPSSKLTTATVYFNEEVNASVSQQGGKSVSFTSPILRIVMAGNFIVYSTDKKTYG